MSKEAIDTQGFKIRKYYNTEVTDKDWCLYSGNCPVYYKTYIGKEPCHACKYQDKIDVPKLLEERNKK